MINFDDYTPQLHKNVDELVISVFDNKLLDFAKIMARFPYFDYKNQLLVYRQAPDSTCIAGKMAFQKSGREVVPNSQPVLLLFPRFVLMNKDMLTDKESLTFSVDKSTGARIPSVYPKFKLEYTTVPAYDISNTEGDDDKSLDKGNRDIDKGLLWNKIGVFPAAADNLGDDGKYKNGIIYGGIEGRSNGNVNVTFAIDRELRGLMRQNRLINMFCTYSTDEARSEDELKNRVFEDTIETLARELVIITVQHYFGSSIDDQGPALGVRFKPLKDLSDADKVKFIKRVSKDSSDAIKALSGYYLSFNETAIANSFIKTDSIIDNKPGFVVGLLKFLLNSESEYMDDFRTDIDEFLGFIDFVTPEFIGKLYELIKDNSLFTYPLIKYEFNL